LHEALLRYSKIMETVKGLIRFDQVSLTGQQTTAARDVLSIRLDQFLFAGKTLATFEFQLQLNKSLSGSSESAYFIFDEKTAAAPFQAWSSNVTSTAGLPVMAVRLDASGWVGQQGPALTPEDQSFMAALVDSLPIIFIQLQESGIRSERTWKDWVQEASKLRQWSKQTLGQGPGTRGDADASDLITDQTLLAGDDTELVAKPLRSTPPKPRKAKPRAKAVVKVSQLAAASLPAPAPTVPVARTAKRRAR